MATSAPKGRDTKKSGGLPNYHGVALWGVLTETHAGRRSFRCWRNGIPHTGIGSITCSVRHKTMRKAQDHSYALNCRDVRRER